MTTLPEPTPTAPAAGQAHRDAVINERADEMLAALNAVIRQEQQPTAVHVDDPNIPSWRDGPRIGTAPPVPQPDSRIVPQWAAGVAVASIGVGAGVTGLGCGVWLVLQGLSSVIHSLSSVTLLGVLAVAAPFAGFAMVATAIGGAISKISSKPAEVHNHIAGDVNVDRRDVKSKNTGIWIKNNNQL